MTQPDLVMADQLHRSWGAAAACVLTVQTLVSGSSASRAGDRAGGDGSPHVRPAGAAAFHSAR